MMTKQFFIRFSVLISLFCLCPNETKAYYSLSCGNAYCTDEFQAVRDGQTNGLQTIGAHLAYETLEQFGITPGQGVTVAIVDTGVLLSHQEFAGKISPLQSLTYKGQQLNPSAGDHGTHVAGIIAAAKNNSEMHGVAYGAKILGFSAIECSSSCLDSDGSWQALASSAFDSVKIHNNSWGWANWTYTIGNTPDSVVQDTLPDAQALVAKDKLIVAAASNDTQISPNSAVAGLPYYDSSLKNNILSVIAYNPNLTPADRQFVAYFSNLALNAESWSIAAPGIDIYSAVSTGTSNYRDMSGTSMASPMVAGAAAVVSSAFPFMGGKQIADTLVSTAFDVSSYAGVAPYYLQYRILNDPENASNGIALVRYLIMSGTGPTTVQRTSDVNAVFSACAADPHYDTCSVQVYYNNELLSTDGETYSPWSNEYISYASVFGVGILDVGEAVKGPKTLDATRLTVAKDYSAADGQFFYTVKVNAGQEGADFSHNIGEKPSTVPGYTTKPVGLRKTGTGQLALSGTIAYTGLTAVDEGTLYLRDSAVVKNTRTTGGGFLNGTGTVNGTMTNKGIASPTITYAGTFENDGGTIYYDTLNTPLTAGTVNLNSGTFAYNQSNLTTAGTFPIVRATSSLTVNDAFVMPALDSIFVNLTYDRPSSKQIDAIINISSLYDDAPYATPLSAEDKNVARALDTLAKKDDAFKDYYLENENGIKQKITILRNQTQSVPMETLPLTDKITNNVYAHLFNISKSSITPSSAGKYGGYRGRSGGTASLDNKFWVQAVGGKSEVKADKTTGLAKIDSILFGGMMGMDFRVNNNLLVGVTLGFAKTKTRQDNDKMNINDYRGGVYFSSSAGIFSLNGLALGGWQQYGGVRYAGPGMNVGVHKEFNGWSAEGNLNAGLDFYLRGHPSSGYKKSGFFHIRPYVAGNYAYKYQEEYKEKASPFALAVSDAEDSSWTGQTGLMLGIGGQRFEFMLDAGYQRLLHGKVPSVSSYFLADTTQTAFVSAGKTGDKDFLSLGGGFDIRFTDKFALNLWLDNKWSDNTRAHTASATFKWFW